MSNEEITGASTKHVVVMRFSAMGDVAMTVPVVKALRKAYPDIKITVLTRGFFKPFFKHVKGIDVFAPDFKGRHKGLLGIVRLFNDLRKLEIDYVADLHNVLRTKFLRLLFSFTKARVAVVDKGRADKNAMTRKFRKILVPLKTSVERYAGVLGKLGFEGLVLGPVKSKSYAMAVDTMVLTGEKNKTWIGVAPFAQHRGKIYPTTLTDELIGMLSRKFGKVFIFGGGPYEREFAECMEQRHAGVVSVVGKLPLAQELDLMSNIDCMVTMDSASMHMASNMGATVVSVWGATHPFAGFYGYGQDPENAVQLELDCRPCSVYGNKPCMYGDYRCLSGIAPKTIFDKVVAVVKK